MKQNIDIFLKFHILIKGMSQGDIARLNQMYKCPIAQPQSSNEMTSSQDKPIPETANHNNTQKQPQQHPRPSENANNPTMNIDNQQGQQTRPNEGLFEQKQFLEVRPQYVLPSIYHGVKYSMTPLNIPGQVSQPSKILTNQPVQETQSPQIVVENTKPNEISNEIPNATEEKSEKSEKPCGSKIFMTFLFKI